MYRLNLSFKYLEICKTIYFWKVENLLNLKSNVYIFSKHSMAAILHFQNGDYILLTFCNISASKHLRLLILVSKHTFSQTMNLMGQLIMRDIYNA